MPAPLLQGAEPQSWPGGPSGVLVLHGFTGNPSSLRSLAQAFANAGFAVELPLLPGHGTSVDDMIATGWDDWSAAAEQAYAGLAARCERVVVAGLSMGAALACWLAARHAEVAGLVCVNPAVEPADPALAQGVRDLLAAGTTTVPGIGSDIAKEGVVELAYPETPLAPLLSLFSAVDDLQPALRGISCPVLLLTSREDHVVASTAGDLLAGAVSGPVERVWLERSYHVATLDWDKDEIERVAVSFARKVTAG